MRLPRFGPIWAQNPIRNFLYLFYLKLILNDHPITWICFWLPGLFFVADFEAARNAILPIVAIQGPISSKCDIWFFCFSSFKIEKPEKMSMGSGGFLQVLGIQKRKSTMEPPKEFISIWPWCGNDKKTTLGSLLKYGFRLRMKNFLAF